MRSGAAAGHQGYFHETAFYGSDEEFLGIVLPFFAEGVAAGEPVVAAFAPHHQRLIREAVGPGNGVVFVDGDAQYARPATAIHRYRQMLTDYVAKGVEQVRIAGDVPHPGVGVPWDWWARYEAAVNHAYAEFPVWGICPYDTRVTPAEVLDDVRRTHPHIVTARGHETNPAFEDPRGFLTGRRSTWRDPLEATAPALALRDPELAVVRDAIGEVGVATALSNDDLQGLMLAATEAVTNAILHAGLPVTVQIWAAPDRMVVTVSDQGPGLDDPFAGLLPGSRAKAGGLGLWLAHQMCDYVTLQADADGFTVRLAVGRVRA